MSFNNKEIYFSSTKKPNIAIILLQMGGPYSQELVKPFLINLFSDNDIIRLPIFFRPLQGFIARMITKKRLNLVKSNYRLIGGGSPIFQHTSALARKLFHELDSIDVTFIMRYSEPRTKEIIKKVQQRGIEKIILFPLYPHYSESTTGSSIKDFYKFSTFDKSNVKIIKDWGVENFYINWWIDEIKFELYNLNHTNLASKIIFSVHGLPKRYVDRGDTYLDSVLSAVKSITQNFPGIEYLLAFQSKVGPIEWLKPYTHDAISKLANPDVNIIFVPLGFVSDHLETLQEIDILYTNLAKEMGVKNIRRVKVPNESKKFANGIAKFLIQYME